MRYTQSIIVLLTALYLTSGPVQAQNGNLMPSPPSSVPSVEFEGAYTAGPNADTPSARETYEVTKEDRGTTLLIPPDVIETLCGDEDGCEVRLGMYNWDNTGRVASIAPFLLYYNTVNKNWRTSFNNNSGTDNNGVDQHAANAWACYFTDGVYKDWHRNGDPSLGFGLLSWNDANYVAGCRLTIID